MKHKVNKKLPRSQHNRKKLKAIIGAIIGAIATFCTISGFSGVYVCEYFSGGGESSSSNESPPEECKIFLYSEYSKITIYGENNMF